MLEREALEKGKTLVIGHRGAAGLAPENTMVSFQKGLECGADILELDIHRSSDGEFVVIHDSEADRTTNGTGPVETMTLAEIKKLDAGGKFHPRFSGERIPTLREVLDWARGKAPLAVEIKGDPFPSPGVEAQLVGLLKEFGALEDTMVISFHHHAIFRIKELAPSVATGILLVGHLVDPVAAVRSARADSLRPGRQYWKAEDVALVRGEGIIPSTWNANTRDVMDVLVPMGFASIGSDFPDRLRACVDEMGLGFKG